ncbi:MAG: hypothetical protein M8844_00110 [marine benthic group bacterium]|nr:hypothetical protein [Gemmatimonadota bacterium]
MFASLVCGLPPGVLLAQETDPPARADSVPTAQEPADSLAASDSPSPVDSVADFEATSESLPAEALPSAIRQEAPADSAGPEPPVSPMGAFFRSLVLPGWGQIAADQPGRGAFYFAMEAGSLWMLLKTNAKLNAARQSNPLDEDLIAAREAQFEDWATLAVFWALFAGVDAWVSAQLWDFTGEVVPPPDGSPGAAFQYSIPVGP